MEREGERLSKYLNLCIIASPGLTISKEGLLFYFHSSFICFAPQATTCYFSPVAAGSAHSPRFIPRSLLRRLLGRFLACMFCWILGYNKYLQNPTDSPLSFALCFRLSPSPHPELKSNLLADDLQEQTLSCSYPGS